MSEPTWADLRGGLPDHATEVGASHQGSPSIETQNATHGAGIPAEDRGMDDHTKYGIGGI